MFAESCKHLIKMTHWQSKNTARGTEFQGENVCVC